MTMNLSLTASFASNYHSQRQVARVMTESWVGSNMYCPRCGNLTIRHFANNRPVADFYCESCGNEFELKSKSGKFGRKVADGAYNTMIERITSNHNPDFFFMSYSKEELRVTDFFIVPKHFFVPEIIEKRNPLPDAAQRAGWIGCNILIDKVPEQGKIAIVSDGQICNATLVAEKLEKSGRLVIHNIDNRGWILDILQCVNAIPNQYFSLNEVYAFEAMLQAKHPQNQNVKPKIRQQLQILRDRGFIEFLGNGYYRKAE